MDMKDFRQTVIAEFGSKMQYITPAHARGFLERIQTEAEPTTSLNHPPRLHIPSEHAQNYEEVVGEFFARVLDLPPDEAAIQLWLFATEMFYTRLGEQYSQQLADLLTFEIPE